MAHKTLLFPLRRALIGVAALFALSNTGCFLRSPQSLFVRKQTWQYELPGIAPGQLTWDETVRLCSQAASLRAEPTVLYVRRGEQIGISDYVRAVAIDSSGRELGEPRTVDWEVAGRAVQLLRDGDELLGRRNGEATLVLSYPAGACARSPSQRASTTVIIAVGDTGTTVSPRRRRE